MFHCAYIFRPPHSTQRNLYKPILGTLVVSTLFSLLESRKWVWWPTLGILFSIWKNMRLMKAWNKGTKRRKAQQKSVNKEKHRGKCWLSGHKPNHTKVLDHLLFHCRFRHGFAFHMEVAFMMTVTRSIVSNIDNDITDSSPFTSTTTSSVSRINIGSNKERVKKKCLDLIGRIESLPTHVRCYQDQILSYAYLSLICFIFQYHVCTEFPGCWFCFFAPRAEVALPFNWSTSGFFQCGSLSPWQHRLVTFPFSSDCHTLPLCIYEAEVYRSIYLGRRADPYKLTSYLYIISSRPMVSVLTALRRLMWVSCSSIGQPGL